MYGLERTWVRGGRGRAGETDKHAPIVPLLGFSVKVVRHNELWKKAGKSSWRLVGLGEVAKT